MRSSELPGVPQGPAALDLTISGEKRMKLRSALYAGVLMLAAACAAAQDYKIGYVNTFRIENESAPALRALEGLKKEFEPRQEKIVELQKQIAAAREQLEKTGDKMPLAERQGRERSLLAMMRQSDQMSLGLAEDLELRKNQERAKIVEEANIVIKAIAEAGKYDLILQEVAYSSPGTDITEQVLKEMAKRARAPPGK